MDFNEVVEQRIVKIRETLASKAKEYAKDTNRFDNFERAGQMLNITREQALLGMLAKHLVSVIAIVESKQQPSMVLLNEKVGDSINYLILLEGMYKQNEINKPVTPFTKKGKK